MKWKPPTSNQKATDRPCSRPRSCCFWGSFSSASTPTIMGTTLSISTSLHWSFSSGSWTTGDSSLSSLKSTRRLHCKLSVLRSPFRVRNGRAWTSPSTSSRGASSRETKVKSSSPSLRIAWWWPTICRSSAGSSRRSRLRQRSTRPPGSTWRRGHSSSVWRWGTSRPGMSRACPTRPSPCSSAATRPSALVQRANPGG